MVSKRSFTLLVEKRNNTDFHNFLIIFALHCSILNIKDNISLSSSFTFTQVTLSDIEKEIKSLNPKKASTFQNIPIEHLRRHLIFAVNLL